MGEAALSRGRECKPYHAREKVTAAQDEFQESQAGFHSQKAALPYYSLADNCFVKKSPSLFEI